MATLERDGVRIHYEDTGQGSALLLTHGYGASCRMWDTQVAAFSDRYRLIRWEMRGHGESASPDDPAAYSHAATVADMAAVLDACGVERAVIGGLSLGGFMSLAFHLAHPARTRALLLCDTGPGYKQEAARAEWNRFAEREAAAFESRGLAALSKSAEVQAGRQHSAQGLAHAARGMLAQRDASVITSLPTIAVPTLLVVGANDTPFLVGMEYMARKIPGATHVVVAAAGHAPNIEQPVPFNRAVDAFLAQVEAS